MCIPPSGVDSALSVSHLYTLSDYGCANSMCSDDADRAGHVWLDGARRAHEMYLIPICGTRNRKWDLLFEIEDGTVIEEQGASVRHVLKSAILRFGDWWHPLTGDFHDALNPSHVLFRVVE